MTRRSVRASSQKIRSCAACRWASAQRFNVGLMRRGDPLGEPHQLLNRELDVLRSLRRDLGTDPLIVAWMLCVRKAGHVSYPFRRCPGRKYRAMVRS